MANQTAAAVTARRERRITFPDGNPLIVRSMHTFTSPLAANEYVDMIPVEDGERFLYGRLIVLDDLDTAGANTLRLQVGDSVDADRYLVASNIGATGGIVLLPQTENTPAGAVKQNYAYSSKTAIRVTASAAATTWRAHTAAEGRGRIVLEAMLARNV